MNYKSLCFKVQVCFGFDQPISNFIKAESFVVP